MSNNENIVIATEGYVSVNLKEYRDKKKTKTQTKESPNTLGGIVPPQMPTSKR